MRAQFNIIRAFTLVELLIVMTIIAILAGLILSALGRAKNSASKATDINNLHQIMIALHTFSADNADALPLANWDNGHGLSDHQAHRGWLYQPDLNATGTNIFHVETGSLWDILRNPKVYYCPMDKPNDARFSQHFGAVVTRQQQLSNYAINGAINGFMHFYNHPDLPYTRLGAMQPADCAFWETDETEPYYFNDGANNPSEGVSARHNQGAIQAAFDASVSYVKFDLWYQEVDDPNKNRLWCYPETPDGRDPGD